MSIKAKLLIDELKQRFDLLNADFEGAKFDSPSQDYELGLRAGHDMVLDFTKKSALLIRDLESELAKIGTTEERITRAMLEKEHAE